MTQPAEQTPAVIPPATRFRELVLRIAADALNGLVGPERAAEAQARLALALRQAALASPKLYEARPEAIANAIALSALTGLMPGGIYADCWLIPKGGSAAGLLWMPSHRGVVKLARRAGYEIDVGLVFDGEAFSIRRAPFVDLEHTPDDTIEQTWDTLRGAYVVYWPTGHREEWRVYYLSKPELEARRKVSDQANGKTWGAWWREMVAKTVIKAAAARGALPLDEAGMAAMAEEDREVIDVQPTEVIASPAPQHRALPVSGLDGLEAALGGQLEAATIDANAQAGLDL